MPDASGRFKPISVPRVPWHESEPLTRQNFDDAVRDIRSVDPAKRYEEKAADAERIRHLVKPT